MLDCMCGRGRRAHRVVADEFDEWGGPAFVCAPRLEVVREDGLEPLDGCCVDAAEGVLVAETCESGKSAERGWLVEPETGARRRGDRDMGREERESSTHSGPSYRACKRCLKSCAVSLVCTTGQPSTFEASPNVGSATARRVLNASEWRRSTLL